jgi:hypothetical protein
MKPVRRGIIAVTAGLVVAGPLLGTATAWADTSTGSISGVVWFDRNSDRVEQSNETIDGAAAITITNVFDGSVTTAHTYDAGTYRVDDLAPGVYRVSGAQTGFVATTATTRWVRVSAGGDATASFGIRGATITGSAWNDSNGDGVRQSGEPGLAGVQMYAYSSALSYAGGDTSDASGNYQIQDLPAGSYQLSLYTAVPGYGLTTSGGGSVLDPLTGVDSSPVQVKAGQRVGPLDVGFVAAQVDTAITAITVPDQLKVGDQVSIDVDVANLGNVAEQLNGKVVFPAGLTPVSATATGGLPTAVFGQSVYVGTETSPDVPGGTTVHCVVLANVTAALSDAAVVATTPVYSADINPANNSLTQLVTTVG